MNEEREGLAVLHEELAKVSTAREGDSNDDHIAALEDALSVALDLLTLQGLEVQRG